MFILVAIVAVSAYFLVRQVRRNPERFQRNWTAVRREARDSFPRPLALLCLAIVVGLGLGGHERWSIVLMILAGLAVVMFGAAWLREFRFLINLSDDVFPGRNDKLIWGILLIVLPPVGVWLFRSYRAAHWPATKTARTSWFDEYF